MMKDTILEILKAMDIKNINKIVDKLNSDGVVSDEENYGISSHIIENWDEECTEYLLENGYKGRKLRSHGNYFDNYGAVYVLFNEEKHSYDTVMDYMDNLVKK